MHVNIQSVSEMSEAERKQMRESLRWLVGDSSEQWAEDHWCVTFENNAVRLGFLVRKVTEPVIVSDDLMN